MWVKEKFNNTLVGVLPFYHSWTPHPQRWLVVHPALYCLCVSSHTKEVQTHLEMTSSEKVHMDESIEHIAVLCVLTFIQSLWVSISLLTWSLSTLGKQGEFHLFSENSNRLLQATLPFYKMRDWENLTFRKGVTGVYFAMTGC